MESMSEGGDDVGESRGSGLHGVLQDSEVYSGEKRSNWKVLGFLMHFKPSALKAFLLWPDLCPSLQPRYMPLPTCLLCHSDVASYKEPPPL